jgi:hypothetical protein
LKTGYILVGVFFKSFRQDSSSFVLFFVLFVGGVAGGFSLLKRDCFAGLAAQFESADEIENDIQVPSLQGKAGR